MYHKYSTNEIQYGLLTSSSTMFLFSFLNAKLYKDHGNVFPLKIEGCFMESEIAPDNMPETSLYILAKRSFNFEYSKIPYCVDSATIDENLIILVIDYPLKEVYEKVKQGRYTELKDEDLYCILTEQTNLCLDVIYKTDKGREFFKQQITEQYSIKNPEISEEGEFYLPPKIDKFNTLSVSLIQIVQKYNEDIII